VRSPTPSALTVSAYKLAEVAFSASSHYSISHHYCFLLPGPCQSNRVALSWFSISNASLAKLYLN
jgi:hypothetical protein